MRNRFRIISAALAAGLLFWVLDGVLDFMFSSEVGLWESIITWVSLHEIYMRSVAVLMFVGFGFIISRAAEDRGRAEATLGETEAKYRRIVDAAHEGICLMDGEGNATYVNERLASMLGRRPEDLLGRCLFDLMEQVPDEERDRFLSTTSQGMKAEHDFRFRRADGSTLWALMTASRMKGKDGRLLGVLAMVTDITLRREAEEALRRDQEEQRHFGERLTALHEVANELSMAASVDALCRRAVEIGRSRLGFDRLSIWFVSETPASVRGSFGVDEQGELRDERDCEVKVAPGSPMGQVLAQEIRSYLWHDTELRDGRGRAVGRGDATVAALWDGDCIIGYATADNLISGQPIEERECELLILYASSVGHLVTLKRVEERLARERDLLHALMDNVPDSVYFKDTDSRFTRINAAQARRLGVADPSDAIGKTDLDFFPAEFAENARADEQQIVRSGLPLVAKEEGISGADGEDRWVSSTKVPILDRDGGLEGIVGISRDITERKRAEQALRCERDFAETLVETAQTIVLVLDTEGRIVRLNPYLEEISGYKLGEVQGKDWFDTFLPERDHAPTRELFRRAVGGIQTHGNINPIVTKDGRERSIEWYDKTLKDAEGQVVGVLAVGQDTTDRKRAEEALGRSERMYRGAIETAGAVVYYRNYDTNTFEFVSSGIEALTGYSAEEFTPELWDSLLEEIVPRGDFGGLTLTEAREAMDSREGGVWRADYRITARDGTERWVANAAMHISGHQGVSLASLGIFQDITERERIEEKLRERSKMEAIGTLAGGIAHDFNNLLQGIVGYSHLVLKRVDDEVASRDVQQIRHLADRGAKLVAQLLAFGRKQMLQPTVLDVNRVVGSHLDMLRRLIGEGTELRFLPSEGLRTVRVDPSQIEQVIMNLASNARDAMPQGGALMVATDNVTLDEHTAHELADVVPGDYVKLTVSDNGRGMDEETLSHAFEPFYTTKGVGEGSGLGLASAYGIVKQHHGDITVTSEVGKGTTFQIYLPCVDASPEAPPVQAEPESAPRGTETILVAEDDETVRTVIRRALAQQGYVALCAGNADEAAEVFEKHVDEISLLLTDVVMPGAGGRQLYDRLVAHRPGLRVLYMSGYDEVIVAQYGVSQREMAFISKPIDIDKLAHKVRELLDG